MKSSTITPAAEKVTFHSEAGNYRIVKQPMRRRQVGETNEIEVVGGETLQFYDGVFVTDDPEEIAFLRESDSNGRYFFEVGSDADRPGDAGGLIKEIVRKGREGDFTRVAEILVAERTSQSRPDVIAACTAMLEDAEEELPPKPQTPLHELQRVRMGPTAGVTPGVSPDPVVGTPEVDPSTLQEPPGAPAAPAEAPAVPVGQVPAAEPPSSDAPSEVAEPPSSTMPSAQGPLVGGEATAGGDATVTPTAPPVGEEPAPADTPGDHPAADGDGGAPGAPAAPPESEGEGETPPPAAEGGTEQDPRPDAE